MTPAPDEQEDGMTDMPKEIWVVPDMNDVPRGLWDCGLWLENWENVMTVSEDIFGPFNSEEREGFRRRGPYL
jgi:hypothetical protein